MKTFFYLLLISFLFFSCRPSSNRKIEQLVRAWQGKTVVFPDQSVFTKGGKDTVSFSLSDAKPKILVYVDTAGCMSCKLKLAEWKEFIYYVDSVTGKQVQFVFYITPKDDKELGYMLKRDRFDLPVCIDKTGKLNQLNHFPNEASFQTFFLDKDNRVKLIGNPIHNLAIKDLYLNQIAGIGQTPEKEVKTTAEVRCPEMNLGMIPLYKEKQMVFEIKNTGDKPLVILDVATTCGCVKAKFDKQPAEPGQTRRVVVEYTPAKAGFFNEVITVKCNTNRFISLKIKGKAQ